MELARQTVYHNYNIALEMIIGLKRRFPSYLSKALDENTLIIKGTLQQIARYDWNH
jgi:hypothetical protein